MSYKNWGKLGGISNLGSLGKFGGFQETVVMGRFLKSSCIAFAVFLMAFLFVPYLASNANATTTEVYGNITWPQIALSLDTGGDVNFGTITPSVNNGTNFGTMVVAKKNVKITSNGKSARVYLSVNSDSSNSLTLSGSSLTIPPAAGSWTAPAALGGKGWGFAVPDKTVSETTTYETPFATDIDFDETFGLSDNSISDQLQVIDDGYDGQTWAALPLKGDEKKIYDVALTGSGATITADADKNNFDVYYAVMVDETLISGTYSNSVVYTAIASGSDMTTASTNISVMNADSNGINASTKRFANTGDELTLKFDLAADAGLVSKTNTEVYLVPHTTIAGANYAITSAIASAKNTYPKCTIAADADYTVSTDGVAGATINCTIGNSQSGAAPTVADDTNDDTAGYYDVWVRVTVNNQSIDYISKYMPDASTTEPAVIFAGLQSKYNKDYVVKTMQGMTAQVCKLTNKWGTGYGASASVYDYTGTGTAKGTGASAAAIGTGTFLLADTRETVASGGMTISGTRYKTYIVRRLADGNCWMVQNLDYDLGANRTLTKEKTNVTADKTIALQNLSSTIGSSCSAQFQSRGTFGTSCLWGSLKDESGSTITSAANNSRSAFARSYNYDLGYLTGTSNTSDPTTCEAITQSEAVWNTACAMSGRIDNKSSGTDDGTTQDSTWQPEYISNSTSSTFTMRGSMYYGDYYNWYAATAESGKWDMEGTATATESICPRGWQLPVNGDSSVDKSWQKLIMGVYGYSTAAGYNQNNRAAINKVMSLPLSVPFAGYYEWTNGALNIRGNDGGYWSSTATSSDSGTYAYYLGMNYGGLLYPQLSNNKTYGFTVRCVAE